MSRVDRVRRISIWIGLTVSLAIAAVWSISLSWAFLYNAYGIGDGYRYNRIVVSIAAGRILIRRDEFSLAEQKDIAEGRESPGYPPRPPGWSLGGPIGGPIHRAFLAGLIWPS